MIDERNLSLGEIKNFTKTLPDKVDQAGKAACTTQVGLRLNTPKVLLHRDSCGRVVELIFGLAIVPFAPSRLVLESFKHEAKTFLTNIEKHHRTLQFKVITENIASNLISGSQVQKTIRSFAVVSMIILPGFIDLLSELNQNGNKVYTLDLDDSCSHFENRAG